MSLSKGTSFICCPSCLTRSLSVLDFLPLLPGLARARWAAGSIGASNCMCSLRAASERSLAVMGSDQGIYTGQVGAVRRGKEERERRGQEVDKERT